MLLRQIQMQKARLPALKTLGYLFLLFYEDDSLDGLAHSASPRDPPIAPTTEAVSFNAFDYNDLMTQDHTALHSVLWTSSGVFLEDETDGSNIEDTDDDEDELINLFANVDWGKIGQNGLPIQA
ncbi:hypothetical protein PM082_014396 [Marasmius tenuissimus]|nr:hypothetical protein PM082_014396 [Marasmius tenuissimus]